MDNIKVTVLIPVYNGEKYIWAAIHSLLNQTFEDFEILIINDGSTDKTPDIIRSFKDDRIVVINQQNGGIAKALNKGLIHAKGQYVARFDADDVCTAYRLAEQVKFLDENREYAVVGSDAEYIIENGE